MLPTSARPSACGPGRAVRGRHRALGVHPRRLGLAQGAVHVEQHRRSSVSSCRDHGPVGRQRALKYLASGWWTTMASVDCSGCSWNSSVSLTPIRSGGSSRDQLRPVLQVGAGRVAERVARAAVALPEDLVHVVGVLTGESQLGPHPGVPVLRQRLGRAAPTARAARGSRGRRSRRTARRSPR